MTPIGKSPWFILVIEVIKVKSVEVSLDEDCTRELWQLHHKKNKHRWALGGPTKIAFVLNSPSSYKIWGLSDKMPRIESKNKIIPINYWYFPLYFHLYLKIGHFSTYHNFDEKCFFGYFKSQISKCSQQKYRMKII